MQSSRECTLKAIGFDYPDRIPMCTQVSNLNQYDIEINNAVSAAFPTDIIFTTNWDTGFVPQKQGQDEWGCVWQTIGYTMGEVKEHPLESWSNFDAWKAQIPDFKVKDRYKFAKHVRDNYPDKYVGGGLGLLMNLIYNLRGMENFFTDLYLEREKLDTLIDLIYETAYDQIDNYAAIGFDGVIAWEDWGLQDRLMMSPELWREVFKAKMKEMVDYIHSKNMNYILHCCGCITDILDDIIDIGVDVLQLDQQMQIGLTTLEEYAGKICFFCPVDIAFASNNNDPKSIWEYCIRMADSLSTDRGGFMYKTYAQPKSVEISLDIILEECNTFKDYNPYKIKRAGKSRA